MKLFGKSLDRDVPIIAEIGVNHEGSLDDAIRLLHLAKESGADTAKFQTFTPERYASASDPDRLKRVTGFDLGEQGFRTLVEEAAKLDFPIFSTAVSEDVVPFLDSLFPVIKIASGDIDFEPVIRASAETGKPVIISTGLATETEAMTAIDWFRDAAGGDDLRDRLIIMHCVSAYPTPLDQANVLSIPYLAEKTGLRIGFSNHIAGPEACLAAVALGACVIETHFTDQKTGREFRDHALSCDPDDMRQLVEMVPRIRASLGEPGKVRQPCEEENLIAVRKGVVAARDLKAGTVLTRDDLMFARPATEFPASEVDKLPGSRLTSAVKKGELIPRASISCAD